MSRIEVVGFEVAVRITVMAFSSLQACQIGHWARFLLRTLEARLAIPIFTVFTTKEKTRYLRASILISTFQH